ncbi:hypothetical protein GDO81_020602 [Engystomops pustulosus]|nr:hypothetical protein GDO81_020602 [Engystomops pustulosus]
MGFTGIYLNAMIVVVNLRDRHHGRHLGSSNLLLSSIGLNNVFFQTDLVLDSIFFGFHKYIPFSREIHLRILNLLTCFASCNYWFTVWLCTYYCLRIVSFPNGVLFLLKMRISTYLRKLLVISALESCLISVLSTWNMYLEPLDNPTLNTSSLQVISIKFPYKVVMMCGTIVPLVLTLIPTGFTLSSLWRHIMMMKRNMMGSSAAQTRAHVTAARTMVLLLTLHLLLYFASLSIILHSFNVNDISQYFCWFIIFSYSTLQALVIIHGNSKLRTSGKLIIRRLRTWNLMFQGNQTGSGLHDLT